jgi:hypothetical protein
MTTILSSLVLAVSLLVIPAAIMLLVRSRRLLKTVALRPVKATVVLLSLAFGAATAQPVAPVEVDKLLSSMPALAANPAEALRRTQPDGAKAVYQPWRTGLEKIAADIAMQQQDFYTKYPTGVRPVANTPNRVSPQAQSSMDGAMAEFTAKMQSDPAFAQEFMKKTEAEQQAYIQKLLANNGLKPAQAPAGAAMQAQPEAEPINWVDLISTLNNEWAAYLPAHSVGNLLYKAGQQHDEVARRWNAELEKVPMIEMGEYGRDRDPKQVEALRVKYLAEHRAVAARTLEEGRALLRTNAAKFQQLARPYLTALQGVQYGKSYDFTVFYANILGQQQWMLQQIHQFSEEAIELTNHVAQYEAQK